MDRTQAAVVAVAALILALVAISYRGGDTASGSPRRAPEFLLPDLGGKTTALTSLRGELVLVNFWATWCPPCVEETPSLQALHARFAARGLRVLGVSVDEDREELRRFLERYGVTYTVLLDPARITPKRYGTEKFPESYLVDRAGRIARKYVGAVDWSSAGVESEIEALLAAGS